MTSCPLSNHSSTPNPNLTASRVSIPPSQIRHVPRRCRLRCPGGTAHRCAQTQGPHYNRSRSSGKIGINEKRKTKRIKQSGSRTPACEIHISLISASPPPTGAHTQASPPHHHQRTLHENVGRDPHDRFRTPHPHPRPHPPTPHHAYVPRTITTYEQEREPPN